MTPIPTIPIGKPIPLPARGSWPESVHVFERRDAYAIQAAIAACRPLLVRGKPGVGKSQLARAAAEACRRLFIDEVVHSRSEPRDLQWHFDAVARLGEAQALGAARARSVRRALDPLRYLSPGPLWWAFDYQGARRLHAFCRHPNRAPELPTEWKWNAKQGAVVLIDEIDKAEADLPNGLLEVLGNNAFTVPYLDRPVCLRDGPPPLVIVTTNEERELPPAFVRRCLVLRLELPETRAEFVAFLMRRGKEHFPHSSETLRCVVAEQLWEDRREAQGGDFAPPGQAEYLDILRALERLTAPDPQPATAQAPETVPARLLDPQRIGAQLDLFEEIADFALKKSSADL